MKNKIQSYHLLLISLIAGFVFFVSFPSSARAIGITNPFGGRIILNRLGPVICPTGKGPLTIMPAATYPPLPYVAPFFSYEKNSTSPGSWVLGLYTSLSSICYIPAVPSPIPFTAYPITSYGSSRPGL